MLAPGVASENVTEVGVVIGPGGGEKSGLAALTLKDEVTTPLTLVVPSIRAIALTTAFLVSVKVVA